MSETAQTTTEPTQTAAAPSAPTPPPASQPDATAQPADQAAKPDATKPADAKPQGDQTQLLFEEQKPEGEADPAKDGEGDKPKDDADKAPEPVKLEELTLPEDIQIPEEMKGPLTEYITANKLDKDGAQKLTDLGVKMQQHNLKVWNDTKAEWRKEIENDPEIGGANLKSTVKGANDVIRKFAGTQENLEELQQDLIMLGLGNKRSFVRFLNNVAKATGNDSASGSSGSAPPANSFEAKAARAYPNMKQ